MKETDLGNEKVYEQDGCGTGTPPDEEHLGLESSRAGFFVDQVGGRVANSPVPEPVCGHGEGHSFGTDIEGEDFTGYGPTGGTPSGGVEGDEEADESYQHLLSDGVRSRNRDANDGD